MAYPFYFKAKIKIYTNDYVLYEDVISNARSPSVLLKQCQMKIVEQFNSYSKDVLKACITSIEIETQ